jgi:predicted transcriptional regulator
MCFGIRRKSSVLPSNQRSFLVAMRHINTFKVRCKNSKRVRGVTALTEVRLKVLKVMDEATNRMDLNEFARMVGLTPNQTITHVQELVKTGLVRKLGSGYGITEKGRTLLKASATVPKDMEFNFHTGIGQSTGFSARNLKDFYELSKRVAAASLEFHLYRGDFENWIRTAFKDEAFAGELANMKKAQLMGENLRKEIIKATEVRYGFNKLS